MIKVIGFGVDARRVAKWSRVLQAELGVEAQVTVRKLKLDGGAKRAFAYNVNGGLGICIFRDCPAEELLEVLAHEWVHIQQNWEGRLYLEPEAQTFHWQGRQFGPSELAEMQYRERPWEAEAYERQAGLVQKVLQKVLPCQKDFVY